MAEAAADSGATWKTATVIRAAAPARRGHGAALCTAIGLTLGAILAHAVGCGRPAADAARRADAIADAGDPAARATGIETGSLPAIHRVNRSLCTSLELDRAGSRTSTHACPSDGLALRLDAAEAREDLAIAVGDDR